MEHQLLTTADEKNHAFPVLVNPLPRSISRRNIFELLDGEWQFALDPGDKGLREQWNLGHQFDHTALWPGSIESHLAQIHDQQAASGSWHDAVVAWYEREFTIPESWELTPHDLVQVTFGACGYETRVWLNGHLLQTIEGEEVHFGGYTSFSYELPPFIVQPVNRLTVRVAASFDDEIPRGKQESHVYKRGGIWYQTISGAVRSIWLEPVERNRVRSRLSVRSQPDRKIVEFQFTTRVTDPGAYTLRLAVAPAGSQEAPLTSEYPLLLGAGEKPQWVAMTLPKSQAWSPENPYLYQVVAQLIGPDGGVSQIAARFGLRQVETHGPEIYLNQQPIYISGILYQPENASFAQMRRHFQAMQRLGCNLVRIHIAGIDPRMYDLADEMGMLLWVEVPSPHSSTSRSRDQHWAELQRMLVAIGTHPSIVIWSIYNEDWGAQDIATNPETRAYIAKVRDFLHLHYPQLLVVDNDGWHHVSVEGELVSDLLTAHLYTDDPAQWQQVLEDFAHGQLEGVAVQPLVVGDPFFQRGQIALLVSEWGGFGFTNYGGLVPLEERAKLIRDFKAALRRAGMAGDVYTQAINIEDEVNGVIDPQTGVLLVPEGLLH